MPSGSKKNAPAPGGSATDPHAKTRSLEPNRERSDNEYLTTNHGVRIPHTDDSLKAGDRGPTLMEDFHFREKMTHFDHERIPERVVHARGSAAHGYFQVYEPLADLTKAQFLQDPAAKTPVFVRFSTVVGSRGSADTVRDARGFAVKFYTQEGNYDLVGNNIPVFFIQDAIKFPDLVHAIKPEPHHEMPQASAAHDTFWDFISLMPESIHMIMWVLSDRAIPRSYRMMDGFGVHTFRFVNEAGKSRFVKFHWKPILGVHSLVWDEAQKLAGKDPDFNRRDLWEAIEAGDFPEYELGVQVVEESDEHSFDFDLLDATKIIPEELVPVRPIGKMTLDRNPDNFFAETEQVAFHPGHVVPGIDFTNDPLLQGRLFSYIDTQLIRLGGPNFQEIPINRPVAPVHNNQRDGYMRQTINTGRTAYSPNALGKGCPMMAPENMGGYVHHAERVDGHKVRSRSDSFKDHYSQATLFWNSQSAVEKQHLVEAAHFELGKVETMEIRRRVVDHFYHVDPELARRVAGGVGIDPPTGALVAKVSRAASAAARRLGGNLTSSKALSMEGPGNVRDTVKSRRIAILAADGFDHDALAAARSALESAGARCTIIAESLAELTSAQGAKAKPKFAHITSASIMFDAVLIPGGAAAAEAMKKQGAALHFINEAFKHCKPIGAMGEGVDLIAASSIRGVRTASKTGVVSDAGVVTARDAASLDEFVREFIAAVAAHRHWDRADKDAVPA